MEGYWLLCKNDFFMTELTTIAVNRPGAFGPAVRIKSQPGWSQVKNWSLKVKECSIYLSSKKRIAFSGKELQSFILFIFSVKKHEAISADILAREERWDVYSILCTVLFCIVTSVVVLALFWHRANRCRFVSQPYRTGWSVVMSLCGPCLHGAISVYLVSQWCDVIGTVSHTVLVKYVEGTDTELMVSMSPRVVIDRTVKVLKNRYSGPARIPKFTSTWPHWSPFHPNLSISIVPLIWVF